MAGAVILSQADHPQAGHLRGGVQPHNIGVDELLARMIEIHCDARTYHRLHLTGTPIRLIGQEDKITKAEITAGSGMNGHDTSLAHFTPKPKPVQVNPVQVNLFHAVATSRRT